VQVLLLTGAPELPQLKNRLALVMNHDQDVDIDNDADARAEYAKKVRWAAAFQPATDCGPDLLVTGGRNVAMLLLLLARSWLASPPACVLVCSAP